MLRIVFNIFITLVSVAATWIFIYLVYDYLFMNLDTLIFNNFQKYLVFELKPIDFMLVQFSPLFYIFHIILYDLNYWREMLLTSLIGMCTILLSIIAGIAIAIFTWGNNTAPLSAIKIPFENYWTMFILLGISIPIALRLMKNRKKIELDTID